MEKCQQLGARWENRGVWCRLWFRFGFSSPGCFGFVHFSQFLKPLFFCFCFLGRPERTHHCVHAFMLPLVSVSGSSTLPGLDLPMGRVNGASALFGEPSTTGNQKQNTDCGFCCIFFFNQSCVFIWSRKDNAHLSRLRKAKL